MTPANGFHTGAEHSAVAPAASAAQAEEAAAPRAGVLPVVPIRYILPRRWSPFLRSSIWEVSRRPQRTPFLALAVIVYLSVHGAVNRSGEPCLLLPGFSPCDTDQWLRLHDLLQYLFYDDSPERLPEHKLLILDCNRMDMN
jgi:hypothetical protein